MITLNGMIKRRDMLTADEREAKALSTVLHAGSSERGANQYLDTTVSLSDLDIN
jgi:hypothetical protein